MFQTDMSLPQEISSIDSFLKRFVAQQKMLSKLRIQADKSQLNSFFKAHKQIDSIALKLIENTAPQFNLFDIIKIKSYEARVHTPIITNLLSPGASHSQQQLFFDKFVSLFNNEYDSNEISSIEIHDEYHTSHGNIDILIRYKENKKNRAIVIENKIYAADQPQQLYRYYSYLVEVLGLQESAFKIIYLTPTRRSPTIPLSISHDLYMQLKQRNTLIEFGYKEDIVPWLTEILPYIKAAVVKETIEQYIKTIKTL